MNLTERQIAAELSAMRPAADPEFLASLDEREWTPGWRERLASMKAPSLRPVLAVGATVLVVAGVGLTVVASNMGGNDNSVASLDGGRGETLDVQSAAPEAASDSARSAAGAEPIAPTTIVPPGVPAPDVAPGQPRRVERTAALALSTEPNDVADVADGVVAVTDRYGGFVVSSNVHTGDSDNARASFNLRVPTAKLQDTLADLSGLAHVRSRNEGSLDITAPFVSAKERAEDADAEVSGLLDQLANASSTTETDAIRAQLRSARAELAAARAEVDSLTQRAELTTIDVTITGDGESGDGSWGIDDAADDAVSVLRAIAGAAIVSLAVLLPLALLAGLIALITARSRKRGRERALDE